MLVSRGSPPAYPGVAAWMQPLASATARPTPNMACTSLRSPGVRGVKVTAHGSSHCSGSGGGALRPLLLARLAEGAMGGVVSGRCTVLYCTEGEGLASGEVRCAGGS